MNKKYSKIRPHKKHFSNAIHVHRLQWKRRHETNERKKCRQTSITLDGDLRETCLTYAHSNDKSMSCLINEVLRDYFMQDDIQEYININALPNLEMEDGEEISSR